MRGSVRGEATQPPGPGPQGRQETVAGIVRTIFVQPGFDSVLDQLRVVGAGLRPRFDQAADLLADVVEDLLAHKHFPADHRRRLHSMNQLERLHKEVKRRSHVVGIFPNRGALLRLVGMQLLEQDDEWQASNRRFFGVQSMRQIDVDQGG